MTIKQLKAKLKEAEKLLADLNRQPHTYSNRRRTAELYAEIIKLNKQILNNVLKGDKK